MRHGGVKLFRHAERVDDGEGVRRVKSEKFATALDTKKTADALFFAGCRCFSFSNKRGEAKKIALPRDLVVWE